MSDGLELKSPVKSSMSRYFDELGRTWDGVPAQNVLNYDETNMSDDPGKGRVILFQEG